MHDHEKCLELFGDLSAYIDEELDDERRRELARHLDQCEACKRCLDSLVATRDALRRTGGHPSIEGDEERRLLDECLKTFKEKCLSDASDP